MTAPVRRNRPAHSCACGLHSCLWVIAPASPEVLLIVACAAAEGDYRPGAIPVTEVLGLLSGICLEGAASARLPPAPIAANQDMKLVFVCASAFLCEYWGSPTIHFANPAPRASNGCMRRSRLIAEMLTASS